MENNITLGCEIKKEIGYYKILDIKIFLRDKPKFIHRFFMNLLLGFKWHNLENGKDYYFNPRKDKPNIRYNYIGWKEWSLKEIMKKIKSKYE